MNKKIVKSVLMIGAVLTMVGGATFAWFSDTETSSGNVLSAGTIDISVDGENPWVSTYEEYLTDMKPSQVRYIEFVVKNVGENPVRVWKHLGNFSVADGAESEPECTEQGGTWDSSNEICIWNGHTNDNNIHKVVTYDMYVDYGDGQGWRVLIDEDDLITMANVESAWIDLAGLLPNKELPADGEILVKQSYHIQDDAGNEYQGDELTFDIDIYAQQVNAPELSSGTLLMENKDAGWSVIKGDGIWGVLKFNESGSTFNYTFKGYGLAAGTNYSLIYYPEPAAWPNPVTIIGSGLTVGNDLTLSGTPDLGMDLTNAKIWLVLSSDINASSQLSGWNPTKYLYEYNLINYNDTNIP